MCAIAQMHQKIYIYYKENCSPRLLYEYTGTMQAISISKVLFIALRTHYYNNSILNAFMPREKINAALSLSFS